jgi:hypothetical protein
MSNARPNAGNATNPAISFGLKPVIPCKTWIVIPTTTGKDKATITILRRARRRYSHAKLKESPTDSCFSARFRYGPSLIGNLLAQPRCDEHLIPQPIPAVNNGVGLRKGNSSASSYACFPESCPSRAHRERADRLVTGCQVELSGRTARVVSRVPASRQDDPRFGPESASRPAKAPGLRASGRGRRTARDPSARGSSSSTPRMARAGRGDEDLRAPLERAAFHERFAQSLGELADRRNSVRREGTQGAGAGGNWDATKRHRTARTVRT